MSDHEVQFAPNRSRRRFPWLRIFDCAQISLSPASVMISTLAIVLLNLFEGLVDLVFALPDPVQLTSTTVTLWPVIAEAPGSIESLTQVLTRPWQSVFRPIALALIPSGELFSRFNGVSRFAISLGLWSLIGLILCRRSAHLLTGNDESTFVRACRYSFRRWSASCGAPLIPLAAALLVGILVAVAGLVGRLPLLGGLWLFAGSPVFAVLGFVIAFLLLATALGWPLMVASVSTDDCDSFGGLSRAYSGLTGRPWHLAFYAILSALVGLILLKAVTLIAEFTIWCTIACTAFGSGSEQANQWLLSPSRTIIDEIVNGIGVSYFWSAAVTISLLIRQDIDGVPLGRLAPDDDARPVRDPFPVVGIPAVDAPPASNGEAV